MACSLFLSRLKALSSVNTTVIELAGSESLGHDSRQHQASTAQKTVVTIGLAVFAGLFRYVEVLYRWNE